MRCRVCGEPVKVQGGPLLGRAFHEETGSETGPDGHLRAQKA